MINIHEASLVEQYITSALTGNMLYVPEGISPRMKEDIYSFNTESLYEFLAWEARCISIISIMRLVQKACASEYCSIAQYKLKYF